MRWNHSSVLYVWRLLFAHGRTNFGFIGCGSWRKYLLNSIKTEHRRPLSHMKYMKNKLYFFWFTTARCPRKEQILLCLPFECRLGFSARNIICIASALKGWNRTFFYINVYLLVCLWYVWPMSMFMKENLIYIAYCW